MGGQKNYTPLLRYGQFYAISNIVWFFKKRGKMFNFSRLIPREEKIFNMFEGQVENYRDASRILLSIAESLTVDPLWSKFISETERRADQITREIIQKTQTTFVTPFDREDIYELAKRTDDIFDLVEDAVRKIVDYRIIGDPAINKFIFIVRESLARASEGLICLRNIKDSKGGCKLNDITASMVECEHDADKLVNSIIGVSYRLDVAEILGCPPEKSLTEGDIQKIIDALQYNRMRREIAEILEEAVDACRHVFHTLGNINLKYA
jgi:predicted phosphate transport protein (TIGR00153 family)